MGKAFDKISAGLEDAIAFAKGDTSRARIARPLDVKAIRTATGKTQPAFAKAYGLPVGTVRDWEQRRSQPDAPARVLLGMIEADPVSVEEIITKVSASSVDQHSPDAIFQERTIEMTETAEEAVVAKEARVTEELVVSKTAEERGGHITRSLRPGGRKISIKART